LYGARGIDARRRETLRATVVAALVAAALAGTPATLFTYASIRVESPWWAGLVTVPAVVALVLFAWVAFAMTAMLLEVVFFSSVCPYFESRGGDIETFGHGRALVRRHRELDALACRLGVAPLSSFGFADDLAGETLVWHDAADGLTTVEALLGALTPTGPGCEIPRREPIVADLRRVADALAKAREKGIRFCLMVRSGDGTNAQEWQIRQGTVI
jgi:hypothetical protein